MAITESRQRCADSRKCLIGKLQRSEQERFLFFLEKALIDSAIVLCLIGCAPTCNTIERAKLIGRALTCDAKESAFIINCCSTYYVNISYIYHSIGALSSNSKLKLTVLILHPLNHLHYGCLLFCPILIMSDGNRYLRIRHV